MAKDHIDTWEELYERERREADRLKRAYTVLEQAVSRVLVEMARDCAGGSIGDHWRMELDDARQIAREALGLNQNAAPYQGGELGE